MKKLKWNSRRNFTTRIKRISFAKEREENLLNHSSIIEIYYKYTNARIHICIGIIFDLFISIHSDPDPEV